MLSHAGTFLRIYLAFKIIHTDTCIFKINSDTDLPSTSDFSKGLFPVELTLADPFIAISDFILRK